MATTNLLMELRPRDAFAEGGGNPVGPPGNQLVPVGLVAGLGFNPRTDAGAVWIGRLPAIASLATGGTFSLVVADDVNNPDPGKVARFAVTVKKLASGTDDLSAAGGGTETAANLTLPATAGVVVFGSIAIVTADMDGAAAGDWVLIRIRRLGSNSADGHRGRVVLIGAELRDT